MSNLNEFFSIPAKRKKPRIYAWAIWPGGGVWCLEKDGNGEWSCPIYKAGQQTSVDIMADTLAELIDQIVAEGGAVKRGISAPTGD